MAKKITVKHSQDFKDELHKKFSIIFQDPTTTIVEEKYDIPVVGNAILVVMLTDIKIIFVKDRADFFVDFSHSAEPSRWYSFYDILSYLNKNNYIKIEYKPVNRMSNISKLFNQHFDVIKKFLTEERQREPTREQPLKKEF